MQTEKQRERLVELLNAKINHLVLSDIDFVWTCESINYLAEYLMSNNVVVLPCKVQDIVYVLTTDSPTGIEETKISKVLVSVKQNAKMSYTVYAPCVYDDWGKAKWSFSDKDFGKTVFLSREEAENVLKERKEKEK